MVDRRQVERERLGGERFSFGSSTIEPTTRSHAGVSGTHWFDPSNRYAEVRPCDVSYRGPAGGWWLGETRRGDGPCPEQVQATNPWGIGIPTHPLDRKRNPLSKGKTGPIRIPRTTTSSHPSPSRPIPHPFRAEDRLRMGSDLSLLCFLDGSWYVPPCASQAQAQASFLHRSEWWTRATRHARARTTPH